MILLTLVLLYLTGFLPGQRIDKEINRLHAYGIGKRILGFVDGNKGLLPWTSLPILILFRFTKPIFKTVWKKALLGDLAQEPRENSLGLPITYGTPKEIPGLNYKLVTVTDTTNKLRKYNNQVLDFDIQLLDSGLSFEITLGAMFIVFKGKRLLTLEEGLLVYTEREIKDAINSWFVKKEEEWKIEWAALPPLPVVTVSGNIEQKESFALYVVRKMESIRIDDIERIIIPCADDFVNWRGKKIRMTPSEKRNGGINLRKYLDVRKFDQFGFRFGELSYELGYKNDVQNIKNERQRQNFTKEQANTAAENEKLQQIVRVTNLNDAINRKAVRETAWQIERTILHHVALAQAVMNKAYKANVLFISQQNNDAIQQALASLGGLQFVQTNPAATQSQQQRQPAQGGGSTQ